MREDGAGRGRSWFRVSLSWAGLAGFVTPSPAHFLTSAVLCWSCCCRVLAWGAWGRAGSWCWRPRPASSASCATPTATTWCRWVLDVGAGGWVLVQGGGAGGCWGVEGVCNSGIVRDARWRVCRALDRRGAGCALGGGEAVEGWRQGVRRDAAAADIPLPARSNLQFSHGHSIARTHLSCIPLCPQRALDVAAPAQRAALLAAIQVGVAGWVGGDALVWVHGSSSSPEGGGTPAGCCASAFPPPCPD